MRIILFKRVITYNKKSAKGLKDIFDCLDPKLHSLARTYHSDNKTNEDKVQDLKELIYFKIPYWNESRGAFSTFIFTCMRNYIRNEIVAEQRRMRSENTINTMARHVWEQRDRNY